MRLEVLTPDKTANMPVQTRSQTAKGVQETGCLQLTPEHLKDVTDWSKEKQEEHIKKESANNIYVDDLLLFKHEKTWNTKNMYISCRQYIEELNMNVGDKVYIKQKTNKNKYDYAGHILAINGRKVIICSSWH